MRNRSTAQIDLELLTSVVPFILATDENMVLTWASRAVLKRVQGAIGMNVSELIECVDPPEEVSSELIAKKIGELRKFILYQRKSMISLIGRWLSSHNGFLLLATPDAKTTEDLSLFSFDDFSQEDRLVELMTVQDEARISLEDAASAVRSFKERNMHLEKSKQELNEKVNEINKQRRAILNMLSDIEESRRQLESINASLENEITERKRVEAQKEALMKELEKSNEKLKQSNRNLQDFVYIASHDLREPLRKISAFGGILADSLKGKLDEDQQENLGFMIDGANRMQQMADALLTYSRVTTKAKPHQKVDLNEVICDLRDLELASQLEETNGTIEVPQSLRAVFADSTQMHQLLQNLIGNSLKYHKKDSAPKVIVRANSMNEGMVKVEVEDNGIGIEKDHCGEVFTMFRRLHSRSEYEGTGIGLTVCKRIVERHGGEIGVESVPGTGSTFSFTIPAARLQGNNKKEIGVNE